MQAFNRAVILFAVLGLVSLVPLAGTVAEASNNYHSPLDSGPAANRPIDQLPARARYGTRFRVNRTIAARVRTAHMEDSGCH